MDLTSFDNDEFERLRDLKSYGILDTGPEKSYDQLTFLAAHVCKAPISLLSFIDSERQWFKSTYGLEIHELPLHLTACNTTINQHGVYEIPDSEKGNCPYSEYMSKHGFRFYAGVPVVSKHGHNMGSLCVLDYRPRKLSSDEHKALKYISQQVTDILEIRKRYRENLIKLKELGEASYENQGRMQEIAHRASMRAIAEMSAGLIYRLRPLSLSVSRASARIRNNPTDDEIQAELQIIEDASKTTALILDRLEHFVTAEQEKWMKPVEVNEVLNGTLGHLEYKFKDSHIHLKLSLEPDLRTIGNYSQLAESFFAVINNAIEAVQEVKERKIEVELKKDNHCAVLLVKDSGMGVPQDVEPFIFQPFFTTKHKQNLGMGLSLARALIQRHKGNITLEKNYNPTTFRISIPAP
ncbi:MAG: ATP-binding protein [Bacteriovoracia bacterium]